MVQSAGCRVLGSEPQSLSDSAAEGLGLGVGGVRFHGFRVQGPEFRAQGSGFRV